MLELEAARAACCLIALCMVGDCMLYGLLQVGLKMQFQGSQGQLMFFFGNKGDSTLERLICVIPPSGQFVIQQGPVPAQLEAKKQVQVRHQVILLRPYCTS